MAYDYLTGDNGKPDEDMPSYKELRFLVCDFLFKRFMKGAEYGNSFCTLQFAICLADGSSGFQADRAREIMLLKTIVNDDEFGEEARQALLILSKH